METLFESNVPGIDLLFRGKVRDVYDLGDALMIVTTDRLSAFDVVLPTPIPGKGAILNQMSLFWFERTAGLVPNHLLDRPLSSVVRDAAVLRQLEGRTQIVRKTTPLKIEAVTRGYITGSGWNEYKRSGKVCGITLPAGLRESDRLPEPIFTPSTKAPAGEHDENIDFETAVGIVGRPLAEEVRRLSLAIYSQCAEYARTRGILIADTKFEFGVADDRIYLIDEVLTPDSSRFWDAEIYEPGKSQPSFDKQFVRDYLDSIGWAKKPPAPELPAEVAERTAEKYREALERLTK